MTQQRATSGAEIELLKGSTRHGHDSDRQPEQTLSTGGWGSKARAAYDDTTSCEAAALCRQLMEAPTLGSVILEFLQHPGNEGLLSRFMARFAGFEIVAELSRLSGVSLAPTRGGLAPWAKRRAIALMRERLSEDLGLDELAAETGLSPFHFARMFKQSVGAPPHVFFTRLRMERACELLRNTDVSVTEIALDVGYSSNQAFARTFRKHRHMSPTDYRRAVRDPAATANSNTRASKQIGPPLTEPRTANPAPVQQSACLSPL